MFNIKTFTAIGLALSITANLHAQRDTVLPRAEVGIGYSYMRANATPGICGCFNMNGGSAQVAVRVYRNFSAVFDLTGEHAGATSVANQSLSLVTFTGGPRFSYPIRHGRTTRVTSFVQGLVGAVHGFDAPFPTSSGTTVSSATNLAVVLGGGVDINLNQRISLRAVQADYGLTHLPNNDNNKQNLWRLSTGVIFHFR